MKRPIMILIIAGAIALYGIQVLLIAIDQNNVINLSYVWSIVAFATAFGLFFRKSWSQYLVYLFAITMSIQLVYVVWFYNTKGWRFEDVESNVISLMPLCLMVIGFICSSIYVFKFFKGIRET